MTFAHRRATDTASGVGRRGGRAFTGRATHPTLLMTFPGRSAAAASAFLAVREVHAPANHFYALEASRALGLGDEGGLRVGLASYTTADEVDRLLAGLAAFLAETPAG